MVLSVVRTASHLRFLLAPQDAKHYGNWKIENAPKVTRAHQLAVPRALVYDVMTKVDPEGLESHGKVGQKKRHRGPTAVDSCYHRRG